MEHIKVLLLDDKEIPREALASLLEEQEQIEVVSKCHSVKQAIEEVTRTEPNIVLIDSNLSGCDSNEAAQQINESDPKVKVAVLTDSKEQENLISAIESGAAGYLLKETKVEDFVESIDLIGKGGMVISPQVGEKLGEKLSSMTTDESQRQTILTKQELEVVKLLAKGATNKEIAETLFVTENTAKVHLKNILGKLELRNRQQVVAYVVQKGLVTEITDTKEKPG